MTKNTSAMQLLSKSKLKLEKETKGETLTPDAVKGLKAVHLVDAVRIYEPVRGTDSSSRYFVVALSDGLKVAARVCNSMKLSVRVSGPELKSMTNRLASAGYTIHDHHASVHVNVPNSITLAKTLGALIGCLDYEFDISNYTASKLSSME